MNVSEPASLTAEVTVRQGLSCLSDRLKRLNSEQMLQICDLAKCGRSALWNLRKGPRTEVAPQGRSPILATVLKIEAALDQLEPEFFPVPVEVTA